MLSNSIENARIDARWEEELVEALNAEAVEANWETMQFIIVARHEPDIDDVACEWIKQRHCQSEDY